LDADNLKLTYDFYQYFFYVSRCIYDIFQLEKIITSQTGRKNKQHKNFNILSTGNEESRN